MAKLEVAGATSIECSAKRGRPLSADRSDLILGTVLDLIKEVGYDQIRMQDVADRACVGLSTIYRRWPTKQDVVRAALECQNASAKFVSTGDSRADVKSCLMELGNSLAGSGAQSVLGFLTIMRSDPELAGALRDTTIAHLHLHLRGLLAAELGDDFPDLDLRATVGEAVLIYQAAVCASPVDEAMIDRLIDMLFAPLPSRPSQSG